MLDGRNILIVEDEAIIALDIAYGLTDVGAKVYVAGSLSEAMSVVELDWSAAILDHTLVTETSDSIYTELRKRIIPFLIVTGHAPSLIKIPEVILSKPVLRRRVVEIIASMLEIKDNKLVSGMRSRAH